jgi:carboxypeptidase Taq
MKSYIKLANKFEEISNLNGTLEILHWDNAVIMPEGSSNDRARQFATINSLIHQIMTSSEVSDLIEDSLSRQNDLNEWQKANLSLIKHRWIHANAVDQDLLRKFTLAGTECEMRWRTMREDNNFQDFSIFLSRVVELSREIASAKAETLNSDCKYDALLDQYARGKKSKDIDIIFSELRNFLPGFLDKVLEHQSSKGAIKSPDKKFPIEKQKSLAKKIMKQIGFDFNKGRLDESMHPFCGGTADDVRITTRYSEDDFINSLMGVIHETGHAMYESGLPFEYRYQPVGEALGMAVHESQSLLLEMQVGRSREFIKYLSPLLVEEFGEDDSFEVDNLYRLYNKVERGLIRVDADEVTYPLHVIVRYEIEKKLIEGEIEVKDLPDIWNSMYKDLLGADVPDYKNGCMQDIHWTDGSFGYFPTYSLGAIYASLFYEKANSDLPQIGEQIEQGDFSAIISWLRENIHSKGSLYQEDELLEKVTGEKINIDKYKKYLTDKYLA